MPDSNKGYLASKYFELIFDRAYWLFIGWVLLLAIGIYYANDFRLDVSAESLVLEDDADLEYYRTIAARYGSDDYLIVAYAPTDELFSPAVLSNLRALQNDLSKIERLEAVVSILNVPLLPKTSVSLTQISSALLTLESEGVNVQQAGQELISNVLYRDRLVSADGTVTALQLIFKRDENYWRLLKRRDDLRSIKQNDTFSAVRRELGIANAEFDSYNELYLAQQQRTVEEVRDVLAKYHRQAKMHLGGVPMIAVDMMGYIKHDISIFGIAVFVVLSLMLTLILRQVRWVVLPFVVASSVIIFSVGFLGYIGWPVTVVSSNFISLVLIFSISLTVHLIVYYQELYRNEENATQRELVTKMLKGKAAPCFYTVITTMVAFASLVLSGIRPVIDFGWMMAASLAAAFIFAFTIFPALLALMAKRQPRESKTLTLKITKKCAEFAILVPKSILTIALVIGIIFVFGIQKLTVENRFIDYFRQSTDIYQGMALIDSKLGGTTPLDIIIDRPAEVESTSAPDDAMDDLFDELMADEEPGGITTRSYWFNTRKFIDIEVIHNYLDGLENTGKVLSLNTAMVTLKSLDDQHQIDDFFLSLVYQRLPDALRSQLISPYYSETEDQVRFSVRIRESDTSLKRQRFIEKIKEDLANYPFLKDSKVSLTGMLVLYNNLLQSLFRSQIMTLGAVFIAITIAFAILFRSVTLAVIAIVPNILAAALVLGTMGWFGIPLDIMTITIAAISVGIAVDDTIHYIHRFGEEWHKSHDSRAAIRQSHASIGRAMYYTSFIITIGFLILTLSSFIPTVYFGFLTGLAMVTALLCDLILLPALLLVFKPYDK